MRLRYAKGSPAVYCSCGIPAGVPAAGGLWGAGRSTMLFSLRDVLVFGQMLLNGGLAKGCCECMLEMTFEQLYIPFCWASAPVQCKVECLCLDIGYWNNRQLARWQPTGYAWRRLARQETLLVGAVLMFLLGCNSFKIFQSVLFNRIKGY